MIRRVKVLILKTCILNLTSTNTDCLLKQNTTNILFITQKLIDRLPIPFCLPGRRKNPLLLQTGSNFTEAVAMKIPLKYPPDNLRLIWINY